MQWTPLTENDAERRGFDKGTELYGDVRLNIANTLRMFAASQPGGSYADLCHIMANEVVKLELTAGTAGGAQCELMEAAFQRAYDSEPDRRDDRRWFELGLKAKAAHGVTEDRNG